MDALKNGVVPRYFADWLMVGREKETQEMDRCIAMAWEGRSCIKFISGEYGSGKSHLIHAVRERALEGNFIVSHMRLTRGSLLHHLDAYYYHIMHNLHVPGIEADPAGFQEIFDLWLKKLQKQPGVKAAEEIQHIISELSTYNGAFARVFLTYTKARIENNTSLAEGAASWIMGEKNIPAALKQQLGIQGDISSTVTLDFLKAFTKLILRLGYSGMILLTDELELVTGIRSDLRKACYETLRHLIDGVGDGEYNHCLFVFVGTDTLFSTDPKGIKAYPALYQRLGLENRTMAGNMQDARQTVMVMKELQGTQLLRITEKVIAAHTLAHGWSPSAPGQTIMNWALMGLQKGGKDQVNTRLFMMKLLEVLDIMEQNPQQRLHDLDLLKVRTGQ